jgi:hypothetical protein
MSIKQKTFGSLDARVVVVGSFAAIPLEFVARALGLSKAEEVEPIAEKLMPGAVYTAKLESEGPVRMIAVEDSIKVAGAVGGPNSAAVSAWLQAIVTEAAKEGDRYEERLLIQEMQQQEVSRILERTPDASAEKIASELNLRVLDVLVLMTLIKNT